MISHIRKILLSALCIPALSGCMTWDYGAEEDFDATGRGLFIVNEGNYQYSNASLSYYDPASGSVDNEIFMRANGMKLGDVAQSMTIYGNRGWIVVNNSNVVFAIDLQTFRESGRITGLTSPRYIHFVSDSKAYVSQLWDNRIAIVDPQTMSVTGHITVEGMDPDSGSTEQIVASGPYVYVGCWSYQREILKIDSRTDSIVARLEVGFQPNSLALDRYNRLWALTTGDDTQRPALYRIDLATFSIDGRFDFFEGTEPRELTTDGDGERLYWINDGVWAMDAGATRLPLRPVIRARSTLYYGLTVDPVEGDIYVADAIDYQQRGTVYRFSADGREKEAFEVGITPGSFCWK